MTNKDENYYFKDSTGTAYYTSVTTMAGNSTNTKTSKKKGTKKEKIKARCISCNKIYEYEPFNKNDKDGNSGYCSSKCRIESQYHRSSLSEELFEDEL